MLKGVTYPSATAALQAYIADYEGKPPSALPQRFVKPHLSVDRLLLSSAPPEDVAQSQRANATYNSVKQMVEKAYAQLMDASQKKRLQIQKEKSVLDESQAVLDNLSSLPGSSVGDMTVLKPGSVTTDDLLQPGLAQTPTPRHHKQGNTSTASRGTVRSKKKVQKSATIDKTSGITPKIKATLAKLQQIRHRKEMVDANRSLDDLDLLKVTRRKETIFRQPKPSQAPKAKAVPSWVNDLANTEITSVTGAEDLPITADQLHRNHVASYLNQGKRHSMDDSALLEGRVQDNLAATESLLSSLPPPMTPAKRSHPRASAQLTQYVDTLSMTTDELLVTSPDGKYLYSHHSPDISRPPAELQQPLLQSRPDNTSFLSADGMNSILTRPNHTTDDADLNTSHQLLDVSLGTRPLGSMLSNANHRHFIQQLMRDIEESGSSVVSGPGDDVFVTPKKNVSFRDLKDLSASVGANVNASGTDFLNRVKSLLATAPTLLDEELRRTPSPWSDIVPGRTPSPGTDIVLDGDRSWEKAQPTLKPPVYLGHHDKGSASLRAGKKNTIMGQFLEECLGSATEDPMTLTRQPQPGSMEALKNILFTVQTMVPSSGDEDAQTSSSEQMDRLLAMYPSDSEAGGVNTGGAVKAQAAAAKSTVPADLQHLLSNSFENEQNTESLDKAMEHLTVLKSLVDAKKSDP